MAKAKKNILPAADQLMKNKLKLSDNFENRFTAEKLWESEESLCVLMNSNPEAVFILDTEGNFMAANEKTA